MNKPLLFLALCIQLLATTIVFAQPADGTGRFFRETPNRSGLFADDVVIDDQPMANQKNLKICSAFNGDLFGVYSYVKENLDWIRYLKSDDHGMTWVQLLEGPMIEHNRIMSLDLIAPGNSDSTLHIYLGFLVHDSALNEEVPSILTLDTAGGIGSEILTEPTRHCRSLTIATDYMYPAANSDPFSIATLFVIHEITDKLIIRTDPNGEHPFNPREVIESTGDFIGKTDLCYGRSPSKSSGRYFAVWEEKATADSPYGHIYTAHAEPDFNSSFTSPVMLDTIAGVAPGKVRNPKVACQFNSADNDNSEFTEVIICERYDSVNDQWDLLGFYNKKAASSDQFIPFTPVPGNAVKMQPDICFNPFDSAFILTCYDSTNRKLPYLVNDYNLTSPDSWTVLSDGYNDSPDLVSPNPQVTLNLGTQRGMCTWIANPSGGNGVALLDAPDHFYTAVTEKDVNNSKITTAVFPNPAEDQVTIVFSLPESEKVAFSLYSLIGQPLINNDAVYYPKGRNLVKIDLKNLSNGIYLYGLGTAESSSMGKILISR